VCTYIIFKKGDV